MTWHLKNKLKRTFEMEEGGVVKEWGGKASVALIYPNTYRIGMGNLAVHLLYKMLGDRSDIACERIFLPERQDILEHMRTGTPLLSIESQRPLGDFDFAIFSISFENDYLNILPILKLSKIPHLAIQRKYGPVLIAGGAAPTLNCSPLSKIFDVILMGESEGYSDDLLGLIAERLPRQDAIQGVKKLEGPPRHIENLDEWPTETTIHTKDAQFSDMHLIEIQRGCPYRCNFCAVPVIYGGTRQRSATAILQMAKRGLAFRKKMGLVGTHVLSHPEFCQIANGIHEMGAVFSPSSVRVADIDESKAKILARSGHKSIALGIEAASEEMRKRLKKAITNEEIFEAVKTLAQNGISRLRLYFMIGLPGETDEDVLSIATLARHVRYIVTQKAPKGARTTSVDTTISHFIPKKRTPFENEKFAGEKILKRKVTLLKQCLAGEMGVKMRYDAIRDASCEAYFSTAEGDVTQFLEEEFSKTIEGWREWNIS